MTHIFSITFNHSIILLMEKLNFSSCSNEELMKIFNELNQELIKKGKEYEFYHIYLHSRRYRQNCRIENDFYDQLKKLYHDVFLDIRFDPIIIKLVKLFHSDTYYTTTIDIPLNKKPTIRNIDDGEYLNEKMELEDTDEIFVPKNLCIDVNKANDFVAKVQMITWDGIVNTYKEWDNEWSDYLRGKGYHRTYEQQRNHKDNISNKGKLLALAIVDLDKSTIEKLVEIHGDDKQTLCQAIIDIYELLQEKLVQ